MFDTLRHYLTPPTYADYDENNRSRIFNVILIVVIIMTVGLWLTRFVSGIGGSPLASSNSFILLSLVGFFIGIYVLFRKRYMQLSVMAFLAIAWLAIAALCWTADSIKDSAFLGFVVISMVASLLSGWRTAVFFATLTIAYGWGMVYGETAGWRPVAAFDPARDVMTDYTFILALGGIMIYLLVRNMDNAVLEARRNNRELQLLSEQLEMKVKARTQALATSLDVSRNLTAILTESELVTAVVRQLRHAFNYYHVQIYLWNEDQTRLLLAGGTGSAGEKLLAAGHSLARGRGLVGQAAAQNAPVLAPDVTQDPNWLPNELLPETRCETAVPIALGDEVLGVLDVQHNVANGLEPQDVDLVQGIANQTAITLRNARDYAESQRLAAQEALINEINQKILQTTDMETAMKVAVQELGRALGAAETRIRL